jgi:hypothetical protein
MDMDALPDELLVQVFVALEHPSHLPAVALVCRYAPPKFMDLFYFLS